VISYLKHEHEWNIYKPAEIEHKLQCLYSIPDVYPYTEEVYPSCHAWVNNLMQTQFTLTMHSIVYQFSLTVCGHLSYSVLSLSPTVF